LILDAAEQVFARRGPDAAGLKDVASKAGVSHGLVTHYFGTFDQLVISVLERRALRGQAQVAELVAQGTGPEAVLQFLVAFLSEPVQVKLITWALLTGREDALLPLSSGALRPILEAIAERRRVNSGARKADLERAELDLTVSLAASYGFALGRELFGRALGRAPLEPKDFAHRISTLIQTALLAEAPVGRK
jgi:TetR/AcrR family transcriptional regulator, repressor for neighboring sulfatase